MTSIGDTKHVPQIAWPRLSLSIGGHAALYSVPDVSTALGVTAPAVGFHRLERKPCDAVAPPRIWLDGSYRPDACRRQFDILSINREKY
jgi:hypothetical protein